MDRVQTCDDAVIIAFTAGFALGVLVLTLLAYHSWQR